MKSAMTPDYEHIVLFLERGFLNEFSFEQIHNQKLELKYIDFSALIIIIILECRDEWAVRTA
jgi:hypothetical protein